MRPEADALSGLMSILQLDREMVWRNREFAPGASSPRMFEQHVVTVCHPAGAREDVDIRGARMARKIADRVVAREREWAHRTSLDLARLADLHDRMRLREAESERRRCFVLGRLLVRAAQADPRWADVLQLLLASSPLKPLEAKALGLPSHRSGKPAK